MDLDTIHQKLLPRVVLKEPHPNKFTELALRFGLDLVAVIE